MIQLSQRTMVEYVRIGAMALLVFAAGTFTVAPTAFAAKECQCGCVVAGRPISGGRTCDAASECSYDACQIVCNALSAPMQGGTRGQNFACEESAALPVLPGTCAFQCAPEATPSQSTVTPPITVPCATDQHCVEACDRRCPNPGSDPLLGNGLSPAQGTGLVCARRTARATTIVQPHCVMRDGSAPAPTPGPSGGSSTPSSQTANTAVSLPNPVGTTDLVVLIGRVTKAIMGILGALALMWMIWGGVLWMTAEESKRTEDAKTVMKNAALGIVLLFFSYGLATAFLGIFEEAASSAAPTSASDANPPATR